MMKEKDCDIKSGLKFDGEAKINEINLRKE